MGPEQVPDFLDFFPRYEAFGLRELMLLNDEREALRWIRDIVRPSPLADEPTHGGAFYRYSLILMDSVHTALHAVSRLAGQNSGSNISALLEPLRERVSQFLDLYLPNRELGPGRDGQMPRGRVRGLAENVSISEPPGYRDEAKVLLDAVECTIGSLINV